METLEQLQNDDPVYETGIGALQSGLRESGFGVEIPKFEESWVNLAERYRRPARVMAVTMGSLALAAPSGVSAEQAESASLSIPSHYYPCRNNFVNPKYEPIQLDILGKSLVSTDSLSADLSIVHDNQRYDYSGNKVVVLDDCIGKSLEQFQIANTGLGVADNPVFSFSERDNSNSPNGINNLAGIQIEKVTATTTSTFLNPDKDEKILPGCEISPDKSSVNCNIGGNLVAGEEKILRVYFSSKNSVINQDFEAGISSSGIESDLSDNISHYQENIYPAKLNIASLADQPLLGNGKAKKINTKCTIRPIEISTRHNLRPLYNGKIVADIGYSSSKKFTHERHVRKIKTFKELGTKAAKDSVIIPVKVCNVPKQRYVEAVLNISAVNIDRFEPSIPETFYFKGHLFPKIVKGKKTPPTWHFQPTLSIGKKLSVK